MANTVRQYVGARYVPKFADPVAWQSGTSYEALTIVTYNNSSYTSKIPVPATVGNPADNDIYWALTGNYNAQVEEYRQTALNVQNTFNEFEEHITTTQPIDVTQHGVDNTGTNDVTSTINELLQTYNDLYFPAGTYKISASTTYTFAGSTHNAAIALPAGASISCSRDAIFNGNCTVFVLNDNCEIDGGSLKVDSLPATRELYGYAYVAGVGVNNCHIHDCIQNTLAMHLVALNGCHNCRIDNCVVVSQTIISGSSILFFGGSYNSATNNSLFGGTGDGDLSVYTGSHMTITNNVVTAYMPDLTTIANKGLQGITIDANANECIVSSNQVFGYYYGIDTKSSGLNNIVSNNDVTLCKVGISSRQGELNQLNGSVLITGNHIGNPDTESTATIGGYNTCAIYVDGNAASVTNNIIYNTFVTTSNTCGIIVANSSTLSSPQRSTIKVSDNNIGSYYLGSSHSGFEGVGIDVQSGIHVIVTGNNIFKIPGSVDYNAINIANCISAICNNNIIEGQYHVGISFSVPSGTICGNRVMGQRAILCENATGVTIVGNNATSWEQYNYSIVISGCNYINIVGNNIVATSNQYGIYTDSESTHVCIVGNVVNTNSNQINSSATDSVNANNIPSA